MSVVQHNTIRTPDSDGTYAEASAGGADSLSSAEIAARSLQERRNKLRDQVERGRQALSQQTKAARTSLTVGIAVICLGIYLVLVRSGANSSPTSLIVFLYGAVIAALPYLTGDRRLEQHLADSENELELLEIPEQSGEYRAEKLLRLYQLELKRYYDQTLRHSAVGIFLIVLGFSICGYTLFLVDRMFQEGKGELQDKVLVSGVGLVSGLLSNFVAAIYLKMHAEAIKSLTEFHQRLVNSHKLHFSNYIIAKIDEPTLRHQTLAGLAQLVLGTDKPVEKVEVKP